MFKYINGNDQSWGEKKNNVFIIMCSKLFDEDGHNQLIHVFVIIQYVNIYTCYTSETNVSD